MCLCDIDEGAVHHQCEDEKILLSPLSLVTTALASFSSVLSCPLINRLHLVTLHFKLLLYQNCLIFAIVHSEITAVCSTRNLNVPLACVMLGIFTLFAMP